MRPGSPHRKLADELKVLDAQLARLVDQTAPDMSACHGVGAQSTAQLLTTGQDNPDRLDDEASFAHLSPGSPRYRRPRDDDRTDSASTPAGTVPPPTLCT